MNGLFAAAFVALYVGHMIGDHVVQTDWQAANKALTGRKGWTALLNHVGGYMLTQTATVLLLGIVDHGPWYYSWAPFWAVLFSGVTHGFIDRRWPVLWLMRHTGSGPYSETQYGPYFTDQTLHIACLFVAALIIAGGGS